MRDKGFKVVTAERTCLFYNRDRKQSHLTWHESRFACSYKTHCTKALLTVPSLRPLGVDSDRCRSFFSLVIDFWRSSTIGQMAVGGST